MPLRMMESNHPRVLLELFSGNMQSPRLFDRQYVIAPGRHWFALIKNELVRRHGVFFQVEILTFHSFAAKAFQKMFPDRTAADSDTLAAAVFVELMFSGCLLDPDFEPLHDYLRQGGEALRPDVVWQVSQSLGALFMEYGRRPELLARWRNPAFRPASELEAWQRELFLRVVASPQRMDTGLPLAAEWVQAFGRPREVAEKLHVVLPMDWSVQEQGFYRWMAEESDVACYLLSPTREFFEQARRRDFLQERGENHPLLDAWGKAAARTLAGAHEIANYDADFFPWEPPAHTALGRLQAAMLENDPAAVPPPPDDSLRILRFSSRRLECLFVREDIERRLEADPSLSPADFAVVIPPDDNAVPGVQEELEYVFSLEPALPVHRARFHSDSESRVLQAVSALLQLPMQDGAAPAVLELVLHPLSGAWTEEERKYVRNWAAASGVVRFWHASDAGGRDAFAPYTWEYALRRLALGALLSPASRFMAPDGNLGAPPVDVSPAFWPAFSRFWSLAEGLRAFCTECRRSRSMAGWTALATAWMKTLFHPVTERDRKLLGRILEILRQTGEDAVWAKAGDALACPVAFQVLEEKIARLEVAHSPFDGRGVFVGPLEDAARLPFAHVYFIGLEDGHLAYERVPESLDVRAEKTLPGWEPSPRDRELAGCLDLLCSASASLSWSWCGRDPVTSDPVAPNAVIRDLFFALRMNEADLPEMPGAGSRFLREREFASRLAQQGFFPPVSPAGRKRHGELSSFWKLPQPLAAAGEAISRDVFVSWRKLAAFWDFPLQATASTWFAPTGREAGEPQEWEPEALDFWDTRQWMWEAWMECVVSCAPDSSPENAPEEVKEGEKRFLKLLEERLARARACGRAPIGVFEHVARQNLEREGRMFFQLLERHFRKGEWRMPLLGVDPAGRPGAQAALRLPGERRHLTGLLPPFDAQKGVMLAVFWSTRVELRHALEAFVALLAHCALAATLPAAPAVYAFYPLVNEDHSRGLVFPGIQPDMAASTLALLAGELDNPANLAPITADMALQFMELHGRLPDLHDRFREWYENEIPAALGDQENVKPLLSRDPVHSLESLVDASAAWDVARRLYCADFPLAQAFQRWILPQFQAVDVASAPAGEEE